MIINPEGMAFETWAAAVSQQFGLSGAVVNVDRLPYWRLWAAEVMRLPQIQSQLVARPDAFDNWLDWATAFNRSARY